MKYVLLLGLIVSTNFSSFLSILMYNLTGSSLFFSLPAINDIFLAMLGLISISNFKLRYITSNQSILMFGVIGLLFFNFLAIDSADFGARLMSLRKILSLIFAIIIGLNLYKERDIISNYFSFHYSIFFLVAIFGLLEYCLEPSFWDDFMGLPKYWTDSGNKFTATKGTIETAGKFYSYDLFPLIGEKTRRIVSFYAEAKPLSSYCMFLYPYCLLQKGIRFRQFMLSLIFIVGFLTYSKGFILVVLLCFVQKYLILKPWTLWLLLMSFLFIGAVVYYKNLGFGPLSHVSGLYTGFLLFINGNYLGVGLGSAGNYTSDLVESLGGGESGMGAMMAQVGIVGLLFYYFLFRLSKTLYHRYKVTSNNLYFVAYISLYGWVINFLYSEASLGFRGNIFVFLTIGLILSLPVQNEKSKLKL